MKKLLSLVSMLTLSIGVGGECVACNNVSNSNNITTTNSQFIKNLTDKDFTLESDMLNQVKANLSTTGNLYQYGLNSLSRVYAIKLAKASYAKITISAKNKEQDAISYYANKNNLTKDLIIPILFLYQNNDNKVEINFYAADDTIKPWQTKKLTIKINNVFTLPASILKNPSEGSYKNISNYLFFTSGDSNPHAGKNKFPYMGIDKYGELRWVLPQASYDVPLDFNHNTILAPINFKDLYPEVKINFYPFVEAKNLKSIDWLGLATSNNSFDVSDYYINHDLYNNGTEEIMIANRANFKQQKLPPNDALVGYNIKNKKLLTVYDMDKAWTAVTKDHVPLWKTFKFQLDDWLHLNALSQIDQHTVLVSSRGLNSIYAYDLINQKITWVITSSDALASKLNPSEIKIILVNRASDLFYGQHGLKYLSSNKINHTVSFITLDNHFPDLTIEQYDQLKETSNYSFFKKVTVNLDTNSYKMDENFSIDKVTFMGESKIFNVHNNNLDYVYTPDSGNITFYSKTGTSKELSTVFKKLFLLENYRITPLLVDNKDFSF